MFYIHPMNIVQLSVDLHFKTLLNLPTLVEKNEVNQTNNLIS